MIDIDKVKAVLSVLSGLTIDELGAYSPVISNAISVVSKMVSEENHADERTEYLASAKANYDISLISGCDDVTSFSAGDIKITQDSSNGNSAKAILDEAMKNASSLIDDNSFAFLGV